MAGAMVQRAVLYRRVSTEEQVENTSLAEQLAACRRKAESINAQIVEEYADEGISGGLLTGRPGLQAAIKAIEDGVANVLIVYNLSRLSRDRRHQLIIKDAVETAGGRILFCDMQFDNTPEGDLMFGIVGGFAAYERQLIRQRTATGRRRRAVEGIQVGRGTSPFGFHIPTKTDILRGLYPPELLGKYLIVEEDAPIVRTMFERYDQGDSLRGLCKWLQESGVPTRGGATYWKPKSVRQMLKNPVYKGQAAYGRTRLVLDESRLQKGFKLPAHQTYTDPAEWIIIPAPALVDEALWERVQVRLEEGRKLRSGNPQRRHMLTGLMRCPECGRSMVAHIRNRSRKNTKNPRTPFRRVYVYYCPESRPSSNAAKLVCHKRNYDGDKAEALVLTGIRVAARHPEMLEEARLAYQEEDAVLFSEVRYEQVLSDLRALDSKEKAAADAQVDAIAKGRSPAVYERILAEISEQRTVLEAELQEMQALRTLLATSNPQEEMEATARALADLDEALYAPELTPAERHDLLARIIQEIRPQENGYRMLLRPLSKAVRTVTSIVLVSPSGKVLIVDTGGIFQDGSDNEGRRVVAPYLKSQGINHIDTLILTHPHADHIGGAVALIERFPVGRLMDNGQFSASPIVTQILTTAHTHHVPYQVASQGQEMDFGDGVKAHVLAPNAREREGSANNASVVLRVEYGKTAFLLTGDAEAGEEADILADGPPLACEVLKVGHHGSHTSTTPPFLSAAHPHIAIISVGAHNLYGHPSREVLERLEAAGVRVYRTDKDGAITCRSDGVSVQVQTMPP